MIGFDVLLEGVVEMNHSFGVDRRAELGAFHTELEVLAVHVIAVGDGVADFGSLGIDHAGGELERLLRLKEIVIRVGARHGHGKQQQQNRQHQPAQRIERQCRPLTAPRAQRLRLQHITP